MEMEKKYTYEGKYQLEKKLLKRKEITRVSMHNAPHALPPKKKKKSYILFIESPSRETVGKKNKE